MASVEPILLDAVIRLFSSDDSRVAGCASPVLAFEEARPGDVVLVDWGLVAGQVATVAAMAEAADTWLTVFRGGACLEEVEALVWAGIRGYFLSDTTGAELVDGVRRVQAGQRVLPAHLTVALTERLGTNGTQRPRLTVRETEVVQLAAQGHTTERIASALFMSPSTAKTHFKHIYAKLGVSNRSAAIAQLAALGLLSNAT